MGRGVQPIASGFHTLTAAAHVLGVDVVSIESETVKTVTFYSATPTTNRRGNARERHCYVPVGEVLKRISEPTDVPLLVIKYNGIDHYASGVLALPTSWSPPSWLVSGTAGGADQPTA